MNRCVKSANQIKGHTFKAEVINLIGQFFCHTCTAKILRQVKFQIREHLQIEFFILMSL